MYFVFEALQHGRMWRLRGGCAFQDERIHFKQSLINFYQPRQLSAFPASVAVTILCGSQGLSMLSYSYFVKTEYGVPLHLLYGVPPMVN